jgi:hypothetical protein
MTNWTQADYPVAPWDTPGLPPRRMDERCANHSHCAYRDDDPNRCPVCHRKTPPGCSHTSYPRNVAPPSAPNAKTGYRRQPGNYGQCGTCGKEWTGLAVAHCPTCCETFTGVTAFDAHRSGSHANDTRHCLDPATVGLVAVTKRTWSGWGYPGEDPRRGQGDD